LIEIRHSNGSFTRYAHNHRLLVRPGQFVSQGDQIAEVGNTGFSSGNHLHFEIHQSDK
jgi:murein DD-endopeptidase MepM/ murein hydrolase activator NlpD